MGDPHGPPLHRRAIINSFVKHDVEFLIVGGIAAQLWGATRQTNDLDFCVRWTPENLDRVGAALVELDAGLRIEGLDDPLSVPHRDGRFLATMEISTWRSAAGDLDILRNLPAPDAYVEFDRLAERAVSAVLDGHEVLVAALDDIITSKETVDRPPDREALPELRQLRDKRRQDPPDPT